MKKRVDELQNFHGTAAATSRSGSGGTTTTRISPPQHGIQISPNPAAQSQYQILNIRDQTQSIQYTYTPAINSSTIQKNNISQQQPSQNPIVHTVCASGNVNMTTNTVRTNKPATSSGNITPTQLTSPTSAAIPAQSVSSQNFPRLKVEDALSYLDQVKYKFGNQPQVYNDFLDIMKEFKSQSIDTPGVIQRVSNLFKGHPELIVGFNTFLPPGYKIEVQANDQGFAYQVSVSVPSPSSGNSSMPTQHSPPATKFIQSSHIIQQPPVNLITSHSQSIHIQPSSQQSQPEQRSVQNHLSTINTMTQNFTRDRTERQSLPASSSTTTLQSNTQQSTTPIQSNLQSNTQQSTTPLQSNQQAACNETSNLHRIQPIFQNDNQPVQFNQAIVYVNKIKCRFQEQPEKYKHFLRILHKYQNEQRRKDNSGKGGGSPLTETEVFKQVAHLFDNQEDLLREFGQFLPDASPTSTSNVMVNKNNTSSFSESSDKMNSSTLGAQHSNIKQVGNNISRNNLMNTLELFQGNNNDKDYHINSFGNLAREKESNRNHMSGGNQKYGNVNSSVSGLKRSPAIQINHSNRPHDRGGEPPIKRHKPVFRDVSYADASRSGTLQDYAFFDKVREALKSSDVYDNFLRCLTLFNQEIVSKSELMTLVTPFLSKEPELLKRFQEFLKFSTAPEPITMSVAQRQTEHRTQTDTAAEIDVTQCKRLGTSYCALPKTSEAKKCSGRTPLCREVLNDTWVSFPSWSEDSTFNTSRKTQYEEFIYRCEDERFELDVVIETNSATIRVLEGVQKKMSKMSADELSRFKLDDSLGGTSQTIHQRALRRIYGDKAPDIIEGLKKNPNVAVPVVLRRLKAKEEEWREAQKGFNQQWREQNEKYYLKSLDHQGINFKHADTKALRSKSLMNQIETAYEERNEGNNGEAIPGPHLVLHYKDKSILDDAANLLIHHVKRQTGIQKLEKARIKHILRQFVPELFFAPRQPLSDDEKEDVFPFSVEDINKECNDGKSSVNKNTNNTAQSSNFVHADKTNGSKAGSNTLLSSSNNNAEGTSVEQNNKDTPNSNFCDRILDANEDIKVEIKSDPDAPALTNSLSSSINAPPAAPGSDLLPLHANSKHPDEAYTLFFANSNWYYFLRLHAILCERLRTMYERTQILAAEEEKHKTNRRESVAIALRLKPQNEFEIPDYYPAFLDMLKSLLDGNMDASTYEDKLRDMYGIHAYIAFTLDRVVSNAVRQLQFCVTERNALECFELFQLESKNSSTGGHCTTAYKRASAELAYQRKIESSLQEETYFKVFIYKIDCRVTIEMLENDSEDTSANNFEQGQSTSKYIERYTNPALGGDNGRSSSRNNSINGASFGISLEVKTEKTDHDLESSFRKPLFLKRNVRQFNKKLSTLSEISSENGENVSKNVAFSSTMTSSNSSIVQITSSSTESTCTTITTSHATSSSILTTSTSSIPPPLIVSKTQEPFSNTTSSRASERLGQSNSFKEFFIDDQEQVKFNYQTYKTVFCNTTNKGYILYRYNSLKRSKQTHPNITKAMDRKFNTHLQKWLSKNSSDLQRLAINDWLLGRNQNDFLPCKTVVKKDNNILETPYCVYNRYKVEHTSNSDNLTK